MQEYNFTCMWINRLDQFGGTCITLVILNDEGIIPEQRIYKDYKNPDSITTSFLQQEASNEVKKLVDSWNEENT